jgi:cell division protein ZapA (FtsZ GTPase activity inhibitor)
MAEKGARNTVTVRIAGEEHVLRSSAAPDYTLRCAKFLEDQIRGVRERSAPAEVHKAVILAALSITDQYFQTQNELDRLRKDLSSRVTTLTDRVEGLLSPPSS